jgi:hypothetical protein
VQASRDAANKQLNILLEQQKRKLTNIETKITHTTERIRDNITDTTKTTEILKRKKPTFLGKMDVKTQHPPLQTKQKH